ncbi:MAG: TRAP transporter large permease [Oscillospiraceae bacterium]|nr:TRAP transporter large permease [Oscillospiraceae bacterium]
MLLIIFAIMLFLMFMGSHVFSSMGFTAMIGMTLWLGIKTISQFGNIAYTQASFNENQLIAPMFIMMSEFLSQGRVAEDIFAVLNRAVGKFKGGLAIATTLACTIFAALCGSSPATAASIGRISIAEMTRRGYAPSFAVGTVAAGGTLGIMIPPSITLCLYGLLTETSIVQLLMAGFIPGLMLSAFLVISILIRVRVNPALTNHVPEGGKAASELSMAEAREIAGTAKALAAEEKAAKAGAGAVTEAEAEDDGSGEAVKPQVEKRVTIFTILPALVLIFIVLGSMNFGFATPIEAAGYGVLGALIIVLAQRRLTGKMFSSVFLNTARTGTMMIFLMICGYTMSYMISYLGISQTIASAIAGSGLSKYVVLLLLTLLWFLLGCLMDPASMLILTIPFLHGALKELGFNSVHIGILSVLAAQIAMITPPVGMNLFILKANSDVSMGDVIKGSIPYVAVLFIGYFVLAAFPGISTFLPTLMGFNVR